MPNGPGIYLLEHFPFPYSVQTLAAAGRLCNLGWPESHWHQPPPQRTPPSAALATSSNCLNSPRWRPGRGGLDAVRMMVEKILLGWGGGGFLDFSQRSKEASCHCLTPQLWTWVQPSSLDGAWSVSGISPGLKEKLECLLWSLGRIRQMFLALSFLAPYRICLYSTLFCLLPQRYLP